jgi:hypothetical protein
LEVDIKKSFTYMLDRLCNEIKMCVCAHFVDDGSGEKVLVRLGQVHLVLVVVLVGRHHFRARLVQVNLKFLEKVYDSALGMKLTVPRYISI